jgi:Flp pilus assembly pilin Flp
MRLGRYGTGSSTVMKSLADKVLLFIRSEDGPAVVEYAVLLLLILLAVLGTVVLFGEATNACFEHSRDEINKVVS